MSAACPSEFEAVLAGSFPRDVTGTVLADTSATLVLDIEDRDRWTVTIANGIADVSTVLVSRPTCSVHADASTWDEVMAGRRTGVQAFLDGDFTVRGSLSTVLQIAGTLTPETEPETHLRARAVEAAGARTVYLEAGPRDGVPLILLHGLGASNASMLPILAEFADDYRVIAPDIPGFGASDAPPWNYTAQRFGRWLQMFLAEIDARGAVVVGNSLGGRIALELAMMDRTAANALVLLCPSPAFRRFRQLSALVKLLPVGLARLPQVAVPRPLMMAGLRSLFAQPSRVRKSWFEAALDESELSMREGKRRRSVLSALVNIYTEDAFGDKGFWDRLSLVECPTLFVWGGADRLVPAGFARHVTAAIPSAQSVLLPDCGHLPQLELPAMTCRLIRRFLTPHRSSVAVCVAQADSCEQDSLGRIILQ